jgi:hypothetical protein
LNTKGNNGGAEEIDTDFGGTPVSSTSNKYPNRYGQRRHTSSLRPPTLMIDLLFGALMLFAFQMGNPNSQQIQTHDIELPTASNKNKTKPAQVLPLTPVFRAGSTWGYKISDGRVLSASEVAEFARSRNKTPILVVAKSESVQNYLDAEQPLRQMGLKVGLAVAVEKGTAQ